MLINGPQMHLMMNHLPIVGFILLTPILALVVLKGDDRLRRLSLMGTVAISLLAVPAFMTGEPAEEGVEHLPGISEQLIHGHEESAELALTLALTTGAIALTSLVISRSKVSYLKLATQITFAGAIITSLAMAKAGHDGGKIRHPEILGSTSAGGSEQKGGTIDGDDD